jgi:hypothetical protein
MLINAAEDNRLSIIYGLVSRPGFYFSENNGIKVKPQQENKSLVISSRTLS